MIYSFNGTPHSNKKNEQLLYTAWMKIIDIIMNGKSHSTYVQFKNRLS